MKKNEVKIYQDKQGNPMGQTLSMDEELSRLPEGAVEDSTRIYRPAFGQYFPNFVAPAMTFLFLILRIEFVYVLVAFWVLEFLAVIQVGARIYSKKYTLTLDSITSEEKLLSRTFETIELRNITNISFRQNFYQRLFNIGTIAIDTAGKPGPEMYLFGIENPKKVSELIFDYKKRSEE